MWCTRWFLPLLLLPFPTAPAYYLVLFLLSLTLHAQPCFYCICLLTALFFSSSYWQPEPLSAPLTYPWSDNITAFAHVLSLVLPDYRNITAQIYRAAHPDANDTSPVPDPEIRLLDRGWCNLSPQQSIFAPTNVTRWELASVEALKADLEWRKKDADALLAAAQSSPDSAATTAAGEPTPGAEAGSTSAEQQQQHTLRKWGSMFLFSSPFHAWTSASPPSPPSETGAVAEAGSDADGKSPSPADQEPQVVQPEATPCSGRLPWLRREYDLKPYGIDLVLDFGWSRSS